MPCEKEGSAKPRMMPMANPIAILIKRFSFLVIYFIQFPTAAAYSPDELAPEPEL